MTVARSAAQILKKIGCEKLSLTRGPGGGYWYFSYDDVDAGIWEDRSVYCCYLNQMSVDRWVEEGKDFVNEVLNKGK